MDLPKQNEGFSRISEKKKIVFCHVKLHKIFSKEILQGSSQHFYRLYKIDHILLGSTVRILIVHQQKFCVIPYQWVKSLQCNISASISGAKSLITIEK